MNYNTGKQKIKIKKAIYIGELNTEGKCISVLVSLIAFPCETYCGVVETVPSFTSIYGTNILRMLDLDAGHIVVMLSEQI